ncbi:divalent metal cation transporter [Pasteurellaceae bacterium HPA106]|uniref:NRAMP family divalent metal transporter n=1 Tax=Spirabiliibacterium pneumoniae TaxID=221400 RepID=UPI001AAD2337|nr:NRAMP family divalent metal transporter [Spirabiliibacterium pneumoniae]MBE2896054.1 divalent metal cation transporter [Spirabiliibacterium pneumoniae]
MQNSTQDTLSTWHTKLRALGPGILMASAAIGGSHLIASTQAGAIYGWQLALIIVLANLFKYPFFRFGAQYTLDKGETLLDGYMKKGKGYIWAFLLTNLIMSVVNIAAVSLLCAVVTSFVLPFHVDVPVLTVSVVIVSTMILVMGKYRLLDSISKMIMLTLTIATVIAVVIAFSRGAVAPTDYIGPSPWNMGALGFIVALMGWMPAPMEITIFNSMWVVAKSRLSPVSYRDGIFDFNVGYITTALLALVFLALGALVQFGAGETVQIAGIKYIGQLINMYVSTMGEWARFLIAFIAFVCIFGTTLAVIDGYSRATLECLRIMLHKKHNRPSFVNLSIILNVAAGLVMIFFFKNALGPMLKFAMIMSFVFAPVYAWLNFSLVRSGEHRVTGWLYWLSIVGLIYLIGFSLLFIIQQFGVIG